MFFLFQSMTLRVQGINPLRIGVVVQREVPGVIIGEIKWKRQGLPVLESRAPITSKLFIYIYCTCFCLICTQTTNTCLQALVTSNDNESDDITMNNIESNSDCDDSQDVDIHVCDSNHNCNCQLSNDRLSLSDISDEVNKKVPRFLPTSLRPTNWATTKPQTVCNVAFAIHRSECIMFS